MPYNCREFLADTREMAAAIADMTKAPVLSQLKSFLTEIDSAVTVIKGTKEPNQQIIDDYATLKRDIDASINAASTTETTALTSQMSGFQTRKLDIDKRKAEFMFKAKPNAYTLSDFAQITLGETLNTILFIVFCIAVVFGGTVASHYVIERPLVYRLFYFVYGAALFPLSLAYGMWSPTYWRSTVFPLVEKGTEGSILTTFPFSFFWSFVAFSPPTPRDAETMGFTKLMFRLFSGGILLAFVATYFLKFEKLPLIT
jgi:hypothetical protein